jgi:hypothetical protein
VTNATKAHHAEGRLKRGWLGAEKVTKASRRLIKAMALVHPGVAADLETALHEPVKDRMLAFVDVLLVAQSYRATRRRYCK